MAIPRQNNQISIKQEIKAKFTIKKADEMIKNINTIWSKNHNKLSQNHKKSNKTRNHIRENQIRLLTKYKNKIERNTGEEPSNVRQWAIIENNHEATNKLPRDHTNKKAKAEKYLTKLSSDEGCIFIL